MSKDVRDQLRAEKLHLRNSLPAETRAEFSRIICEAAFSLLKPLAGAVHLYLNFRTEVETLLLAEWLLQEGRQVFSPRVEPPSRGMKHLELRPGPRSLGAYGIPEPVGEPLAALPPLAAVVLPLAVFDRRGNRLGYGLGYYDRFLAAYQNIPRIGLAYSIQEAEEIPAEPHDIPLTTIVTEREVLRIGE